MNSRDYWARRAADRMDSYMDDAESLSKELNRAYINAGTYLSDEAGNVLKTFQDAFELSEAEARRLLSNVPDKSMTDKLRQALSSMTDPDKRRMAEAQISSAAYAYRINRLNELSGSIEKACSAIAKSEIASDTAFLSRETEKAFLNGIFDVQKQTGVSSAFDVIPKSRIEEILKENWSGKNYSQRIWGNTEALADSLKDEMLAGIMSGKSEAQMYERIMERCAVGAFEAKRLVRTETCHIANKAELESYKASDIEQYEFSACIDGRTSDVCREFDGEIFELSEAKTGVNLPPMHPFCRSTTLAVLPDEDELDRELAELEEEIGADIDFEEWKASLQEQPDGKLKYVRPVDKSGESGILRDEGTGYEEITDSAIESCCELDIPDITEEQNGRFNASLKNVLQIAKHEPVGTEVSLVLDLDFEEIPMHDGSGFKVGEIGKAYIEDPGIPFISIHNHPSGAPPGIGDLYSFINSNNSVAMATIANSGESAYFVCKTNEFDANLIRKHIINKTEKHLLYDNKTYAEVVSDNEYISLLNDKQKADLSDSLVRFLSDILKECEQYGVKVTAKKAVNEI